MSINLNGSDDAGYRYTMPCVNTTCISSGNGVKTRILNASAIAEAIGRTPIVLMRYLGIEVGASCVFDKKEGHGTLKGVHTDKDLQTLVLAFVRDFVLCTQCASPETVLALTKKNNIKVKCVACGQRNTMQPDAHKIVAHIIKDACAQRVKHHAKKQRTAAHAAAACGNVGTTPT